MRPTQCPAQGAGRWPGGCPGPAACGTPTPRVSPGPTYVQPADDAKLTPQILMWILVGWGGVGVFLMIRLLIVFPYRGYAVRQHDIIYKKGWLWRSITTIPFQRVQHCDIKQGLIERYFGLSRLNVYTAGGQQSDLRIPGLQMEQAEKFKQFILKTISLDDEEE